MYTKTFLLTHQEFNDLYQGNDYYIEQEYINELLTQHPDMQLDTSYEGLSSKLIINETGITYKISVKLINKT
jgi:hypothetical protein